MVGHLAEVFHHEAVLCPVHEDRAVASVGDEFVRMLGNAWVEVVLDHQHDGSGLLASMRIVADGACLHLVTGTIAVHVDATIGAEFFGKLGCKRSVELLGEISQGIAQGKALLFGSQNVLATGCMVDIGIVCLRFGQVVGDAGSDVGLEFLEGHKVKSFLRRCG